MMSWKHVGLCVGMMGLLSLAGCKQGRVVAPVTDGWQIAKARENLYTVQADDTLYSIAWAFDTDYRYLAKINNLKAPYDLTQGQRLKVQPKSFSEPISETRDKIRTAKASSSAIKSSSDQKVEQTSHFERPIIQDKPATPAWSEQSTRAAAKLEQIKPAESPAPIISEKIPTKDVDWVWPAKGELISRFNSTGSGPKGIDIASTEGSPVIAAKSGEVVYSGDGLRGYGKLLIIKHSNEFLSAYAHNSELFVQEGQSVQQGQKIAAMGKTGAGSVKLHFEIRQSGTPVDPMQYLKAVS